MPETTLKRWGTNTPVPTNILPAEDAESAAPISLSSNSESFMSSDDYSDDRELLSGDDLHFNSNDIFTVVSSSEDDLIFEINEVYQEENETMLYDQANISLNEAVFKILDMWVKQNLTKTTLSLQLDLINSMLPNDNCLPKSVYKFFKYVENQVPPCSIIKHFFCRSCSIYLSSLKNCSECGENEISYFFELDFIQQIKRILESSDVSKYFKEIQASTYISDIADGTEYKRVNNGRQNYDLTLILYTDGVSLSKSSKTYCWPLMFIIAELPPEIRNNYIITAGLWFDTDLKPPMNLFLQPFCLKIIKCFDDGIQWIDPVTENHIKSTIRVPLIIADAPARAQILNMLNFNGRFGCNMCEIETKQCESITGKRRIRIYPYKKRSVLRKGSVMETQGQQVDESLDLVHIKGVKGCSIISCLPLLDLGTCVIPEYMHSVLLGVVKQFLNIWLCKRGPWKIKKHVGKIDRFLKKIKPLNTFARKPRSILEYRSYKATEFYNWLMFYSIPTLKNVLPAVYLQHWHLLVISLFNLLKKRIKSDDITLSNNLLHIFVKQIKSLYGEREMTYNVHQLLHLCLSVERWGPLWATSAFSFESHNGFLAKIVHGTYNMGQEMMNNLKIVEGTNILKTKVKPKNIVSNKNEFHFDLLGKSVRYKHNADLLLSMDLDPKIAKFYSRVKVGNDTYTSTFYKTTKFNNFTVQIELKDGSFFYGAIQIFFTYSNKLYFIASMFDIDESNILSHNDTAAVVKHIIPIIEPRNFKLIQLDDVKYLSHLIRVGRYVCKNPNLFKTVL